jgi:hypothetical protein
MLDDVERRRFLVQPSRKDPLELALGIADVKLDEGAGKFLFFPGRAGLAGAKANDHVADAERLSRFHLQVAGNAVALVEKADHGDAFRHRRRPRRDRGHGLRNIDGLGLGLGLRIALRISIAPRIAAAARKHIKAEKGHAGQAERRPHPRSGVQAS